ncbi:3-mercaptopropionate dioxygenase [Geodia barretti]|uniref:3-mercaptopropionate dioxygenase n=1 Tax=Geodia barretti TaxID=519541 RepID=A0AA35RX98_GEOBA|nr:3-mercaptopropionate dioxygenase [Geodia barretti]
MVAVKYTLEDFVHDMDNLLVSQPTREKIFDRGSDCLSRLISNPDAIPGRFRQPVGSGGRANHGSWLLHHSPDSGLLVTAVVWGPGDHAAPHDHRTWGMIGVMDNALTETRFRRVDDHERTDWAQLERDRSSVVKPGEISLLIPEVDEIHQMDNFTDRPTVEVHVYGQDLRGLERVRYDLETGAIRRMMTEKYDNC